MKKCLWWQLSLTACPCLCCLKLSLPGAVSLPPCLLLSSQTCLQTPSRMPCAQLCPADTSEDVTGIMGVTAFAYPNDHLRKTLRGP